MLNPKTKMDEILIPAKALAPLMAQPGWRTYSVVMEPGDATRYEVVLSERIDPWGHRGDDLVVTVLSPCAKAFVWSPSYTTWDYVAEKLHCDRQTATVVGVFLSTIATEMRRLR